MVRIVLDANQFVSALLKPDSNPAIILAMVQENRVRLLMSEAIIAEIDAVLRYPKIMKRHGKEPEFLDPFMKRLRSVSQMTEGKLKIDIIKDDPDDNKYLECAMEGRVDYIISGDHHLTALEYFYGIPIVPPQTFLLVMQDTQQT
jgi:uncharacterized protein